MKKRCGTPQGGVISPLLANLYLDGLDKAVNGGKQMKAVMVRYADDYSNERLHDHYGLINFPMHTKWQTS